MQIVECHCGILFDSNNYQVMKIKSQQQAFHYSNIIIYWPNYYVRNERMLNYTKNDGEKIIILSTVSYWPASTQSVCQTYSCYLNMEIMFDLFSVAVEEVIVFIKRRWTRSGVKLRSVLNGDFVIWVGIPNAAKLIHQWMHHKTKPLANVFFETDKCAWVRLLQFSFIHRAAKKYGSTAGTVFVLYGPSVQHFACSHWKSDDINKTSHQKWVYWEL